MTDEKNVAEPSGASGGYGLFRVLGALHWSCNTEKGHQRIAMEVDIGLPFPPFVGLCIQLGDEVPSPKIKSVVWCHHEQAFHIHATMRLRNWGSELFESLVKDIRNAGPNYEPKLYDDNWMYEQQP
jgi:hypothetical protein